MNLRALTRGDAAVAGAAVLLFISSFLPYFSFDYCGGLKSCASTTQNAWSATLFPILPSVFLLGIIAAALILVQRFQGEAVAGRQVLGLRLDQWGIALAFAGLWSALWALGGGGVSHGFGAWLGVLAMLVLAGAAAGGPLVPALQAPLLTDKPPVTQAPYAGAPAGGFQPGQYGYPADQGLAQGQPGQGGLPGYGTPPEQQHGYGYPTPGQATGQPAPAHQDPTQVQAAVTTPAPAADFAPFWFAVPAPRQLAPKDNPAGPPVGELVPGTWYLAIEQRGNSLVAQLQDGSHGLLNDASGIQRG
ncbi:DUF5336 domain-containing protein [Kitasatospora sp. CMC57]|uniref:DUF5336 domain-containing protein n=1 Tax=Kitasatospora sp. CMC57 TaxID=3231513 RepID=A0AB33K1X7_9ACTN